MFNIGRNLSGFCHFGLMSFMGFVTEPWHSRHVLFSCELEPCAFSSACLVLCRSVLFGSWHSCLEFCFVSGFGHSCSMFCLVLWACGLKFTRPRALLFTCVVFCVVAHSSCFIGCVMLCLVLCGTQLVFFMGCVLSCCHVLWTCGLWVFSLFWCPEGCFIKIAKKSGD